MDEVPVSLGLQLIDAQNLKEGNMRERRVISNDEDLEGIIDKAFKDIGYGGKN